MSTVPTDHGVASLGEFVFECGQSVPDLEVAYETHGEFDGDNVVLVCHALTGSQNVARSPAPERDDGTRGAGQAGQARAWWDDIVGPGKAIDTTEYYVVCANVPGSCYGTTGPASERPADLELPEAPDHDRWGPPSRRCRSRTGRAHSAACWTTSAWAGSGRSSAGASAG